MKYATPYQYATLCGISPQAVYQRISNGLLDKVQIPTPDGKMKDYIDIEKHPPTRLKNKFGKSKNKE